MDLKMKEIMKLDREMVQELDKFDLLQSSIKPITRLLKNTMISKTRRAKLIKEHRTMFLAMSVADERISVILEEMGTRYGEMNNKDGE